MVNNNRRCHYYDIDGDPIDGGCPRPSGVCDFLHPEQKGWSNAKIPYRIKRYSKRSPSPPPFGYHRDSGYPRNRHRKSRSRSRSPPPPCKRQDSIASSVPDNLESLVVSDPRKPSLTDMFSNSKSLQQTLPPRPSSPPKTQKEQPQASSSLINSTSSLPTPPQAAVQSGHVPFPLRNLGLSTSTAMKTSIPNLPRAMRPPPSVNPRSSLRTSPPPPGLPPPPKTPAPMLPPPPPPLAPPLPAIPPALSAGLESMAPVQPTAEGKRAMWEERIRILSEVELAREKLAVLEEQHVFALRIVESNYFTNLPQEDRTRLKSQLAELETQREEAKKLHVEWVEKLFKTGSWPVGPPSSADDGVEEKHKEIVKYIQELKDTALQMSKILGDISTIKSPPRPLPPPLFLSGDSDEEDGTAMDVDQSDGAHPKSLKRRHISENLDGRGGGGGAPSLPTQEDLDEFLERLTNMEGLISTLENDITQHGRETKEELEQLVDAKFDEFRATREEEERQRLEEEQQRIQHVEQDITVTGEQVGELATEIGDLIARVGKLEVDVGAARQRRQESFGKVLEVERRLQDYISTRDANVRTIQTFEKALNAYTSRPPSPPATPLNAVVPCFDYLFQTLEEPLVQSLRSHLVPAIEDLRKDVENIVRTQNAELYSTLWNKITVTLKVLEMIQSKVNSGDLDIEPGQSMP